MERLNRAVPTALAAVVLSAALSTCSNPVDFRAAVVDQVMLANKKYLEVSEVTPVKNSTTVSPEDLVIIEFDRDINPATVGQTTILFDPPATWGSSYNSAARTLTIDPDALAPLQPYTLTVTDGVRGTDGSALREHFVWSFTTINAPSGSLVINGDAPYATSASVTLMISANSMVTHMRYTQNQAEITGDSLPWVPVAATVNSYGLTGGDGLRTVYAQFKYDQPGQTVQETGIKSDSVVLDTVDPVVTSFSVAAGAAYCTSTSVALTTTATDATSGLDQMQFSNDGTNWSSWEAWNTTRSVWALSSGDGGKTVRVRVKDKAGRLSAVVSDGITLDATPPSVPTFHVNDNAAYTTSTAVTLTISASDALSGLGGVRYSNNGTAWSSWEDYSTSKAWALPTGDGSKTIYIQVRDVAGNVTPKSDTITLDRTPPAVSLFEINYRNPASTDSPSVTLYISATDATSGLSQSRYGNYGKAWSDWETYAAKKTWTLEDKAGTRRVYLGVRDNAGNETATSGTWDEIVLNARVTVTYNALYISNDGDPTGAGEIYYRFYIDGALTLNRPEANYLSINSGTTITSQLPPSSYTIYRDPTSGSFTMTGTVYDDDAPFADDYGTMAPITYSAPFPDLLSAARTISGDVAGTIYYTIDLLNP